MANGVSEYRPEIDGLRGLAIGAVVAGHFGMPGFPGGFLGVDVFFCISGYLITGIILDDLDAGRFQFSKFAARRIKRLFPALFLMLATVGIASGILHSPGKFEQTGNSLAAAALYYSNLHFFILTTDYFSEPAEAEPLLHTWSLAVEEQFYIVWPLILIGVYAAALPAERRKNTLWVAIALGGASLASTALLFHSDRTQVFYLLHGRAWELLAGALLAIWVRHLPVSTSGAYHMSDMRVLTGLVLVAGSFTLASASSPLLFSALPAVVGTLVLLVPVAKGTGSLTQLLLANPFAVLFGKFSYSLYLWHWPVYVFALQLAGSCLGVLETVLAIVVSLAVALLSWRFVESPARACEAPAAATVAAGIAGSLALFGAGFVLVPLLAVSPLSGTPEVAMLLDYANERDQRAKACMIVEDNLAEYAVDRCRIGATSGTLDFVVLGDSHADHWVPGLHETAEAAGLGGLELTGASCLPVLGLEQHYKGNVYEPCRKYRRKVAEFLDRLEHPTVFVLAARWSIYYETDQFMQPKAPRWYAVANESDAVDKAATQALIEMRLGETVNGLLARGHAVLLLDQVPEFGSKQLDCVIRTSKAAGNPDLCGPGSGAIRTRLQPASAMLERVARTVAEADLERFALVAPAAVMCDERRCRHYIRDTYLYRDSNHLNPKGSRAVVDHLNLNSALSRLSKNAIKQ